MLFPSTGSSGKGFKMHIWLLDGAVAVALLGAWFDVVSRRIPNRLTYPAMLAALVVRLAFLGWRSLLEGFLGLMLCGGVFFLLFVIHAMGGGDVKLMAAVGAWVGYHSAGIALIVCALAGGLIALGYVVILKRYRTTFSNIASLIRFHAHSGLRENPELNLSSANAVRMPYGLAIAAGAVGTLISTVWKG
jgi:prepilin peptidase CpaA